MRSARRQRGAALLVAALFLARGLPTASAQTVSPAVKAEARMRFDLGLKLFNDGNDAGALAEFHRAYDLIPNPLVLYNMGLVYADMGRSVEAQKALDDVLANPGSVTGDKLAHAKEVREQQALRVAALSIVTNVPATVEVDGVGVGQTPLPGPIRVTSGIHVLGAVASGYVALRKEITVAGGRLEEVTLALQPMERVMAHATLRTHLPGAGVFVDGQPAGTTPLAESLTLQPGTHVLELRREGYRTAKRELSLGEGATAEVELEPEEDRAAIAGAGAVLALDISEPNAQVSVEGTPRGLYVGSLTLAPGPHHLVVERGEFEPKVLDVVLPAHTTTTRQVVLDPTPETRAAYEHKRAQRHINGLLVIGGGVAVIGGSIAFIVWNAGQVSHLMGPYNAAYSAEKTMAPPYCDTSQAGSSDTICNMIAENAYAPLHSAEELTPVGYIGLGLGVAATVTGLVLYFTAGSADRFRAAPPAAVSGWTVLPWGGPRDGGMAATLRF